MLSFYYLLKIKTVCQCENIMATAGLTTIMDKSIKPPQLAYISQKVVLFDTLKGNLVLKSVHLYKLRNVYNSFQVTV